MSATSVEMPTESYFAWAPHIFGQFMRRLEPLSGNRFHGSGFDDPATGNGAGETTALPGKRFAQA
jgi:hypothetical protein